MRDISAGDLEKYCYCPLSWKLSRAGGLDASMAEGAISAKHKELIALAIGVTQRCSGCVGFHVKALHRLGCTRAELEEMLAVCVYMGGGPSLMYAANAMAAYEEFAAATA